MSNCNFSAESRELLFYNSNWSIDKLDQSNFPAGGFSIWEYSIFVVQFQYRSSSEYQLQEFLRISDIIINDWYSSRNTDTGVLQSTKLRWKCTQHMISKSGGPIVKNFQLRTPISIPLKSIYTLFYKNELYKKVRLRSDQN